VLAPAEEKWREAPQIPLQLDLVFTVLLTIIGGLMFAAAAAAAAWGRAHPPTSLRLFSAVAGILYAGVLLGGAEYSDRVLRWQLPIALFWTLVFSLPALFGIAVWRGGRVPGENARAG
jgi:hypothetical protein